MIAARDLGLDQTPGWMLSAVCASILDDDVWYPPKGGSTREAKAICQRCPAIAECLAYALANEEKFGVWGGKSERERHRMRPHHRSGPASAGIGRGGDHACLLNGCAYSGASIAALRKHRDRWHKAAA